MWWISNATCFSSPPGGFALDLRDDRFRRGWRRSSRAEKCGFYYRSFVWWVGWLKVSVVFYHYPYTRPVGIMLLRFSLIMLTINS